MGAAAIAGGIAAVGAIGGAAIASSGAQSAADTQAKATTDATQASLQAQREALAQQKEIYGQQTGYFAPYRQIGLDVLPQYYQFMGMSPGGTSGALTSSEQNLLDQYAAYQAGQPIPGLAETPQQQSSLAGGTTPLYVDANGNITTTPQSQLSQTDAGTYQYSPNTAFNQAAADVQNAPPASKLGQLFASLHGDSTVSPLESVAGQTTTPTTTTTAATGTPSTAGSVLNAAAGATGTQNAADWYNTNKDAIDAALRKQQLLQSTATPMGAPELSPLAQWQAQQEAIARGRSEAARGINTGGGAVTRAANAASSIAAQDYMRKYGMIMDALNIGSSGAAQQAAQGSQLSGAIANQANAASNIYANQAAGLGAAAQAGNTGNIWGSTVSGLSAMPLNYMATQNYGSTPLSYYTSSPNYGVSMVGTGTGGSLGGTAIQNPSGVIIGM